jgi:hypothetical protein
MSLSLTSLAMPFPRKKNPHYDALQPAMSQEMIDRGLIASDQVPYHVGFNLLNAYFFPHTPPALFINASKMIDFFFLCDDIYDTSRENGRNTPLVEGLLRANVDVLKSGKLPETPDALNVLAHDTLLEMSGRVPGFQIARLTDSISDYLLNGSLALMKMWKDDHVPSIEEYIEIRQYDVAGYATIDVAELASGLTLSPDVHGHEALRAMRRACCLNIAMTNDILSYQKEVIRDGCPYNAVHSVQVHRGVSVEEALLTVIEIASSYLQTFASLKQRLPRWGGTVDTDVERYVSAMEDLMAGNYYWSFDCTRYSSADSPFVELRTTEALLRDKSRGLLVTTYPRREAARQSARPHTLPGSVIGSPNIHEKAPS